MEIENVIPPPMTSTMSKVMYKQLDGKRRWINQSSGVNEELLGPNQPERSKREDFPPNRPIGNEGLISPPWNPYEFPDKCEGWLAFQEYQLLEKGKMRCSEHDSNAVRDK